jgi:hypothetical protein
MNQGEHDAILSNLIIVTTLSSTEIARIRCQRPHRRQEIPAFGRTIDGPPTSGAD